MRRSGVTRGLSGTMAKAIARDATLSLDWVEQQVHRRHCRSPPSTQVFTRCVKIQFRAGLRA